MRHQSVLGCRHPLVAVAMNQVSDLQLALACHAAGILPSLSSFNHHVGGRLDQPSFLATLAEFSARSGSTRLLLSMNLADLSDTPLFDAIGRAGFDLIELFKWNVAEAAWQQVLQRCAALEASHAMRFFFKLHRRQDALDAAVQRIVFKGNDGAGRTDPGAGTLDENIEALRAARPALDIIASGGIGSAADVRRHLQRGVLAVGVGTLFAAAEESCLAKETKLKMVQAAAADLQRFGPLASQGLVFSRLARDNANNTEALRLGIRGGNEGAVFAGKGIGQVDAILPVHEIVARLLADAGG